MVLPARAAGVAVWLGGISLGGLIALDYAVSYPDELDGLCLLAPYLGNRMLTAEIAHAPGLAGMATGRTCGNRRRTPNMALYQRAGTPLRGRCILGYGKGDRFSAAHEFLAAALPADCGRCGCRRPRVGDLVETLGEFLGFAIWRAARMSGNTYPPAGASARWSPPPLLYASAAVHLGAAAAVLAASARLALGAGRPWSVNHVVLGGGRTLAAKPASGSELGTTAAKAAPHRRALPLPSTTARIPM